jgi:hypothetical protein
MCGYCHHHLRNLHDHHVVLCMVDKRNITAGYHPITMSAYHFKNICHLVQNTLTGLQQVHDATKLKQSH